MEAIHLDNWAAFESALHEIKSNIHAKKEFLVSDFLFRGQSYSDWPLETTLERFTHKTSYTFAHFYARVLRVAPEIAAFTGQHWSLPSPEKYKEWLREFDSYNGDFLAYEPIAHLRHHGFPSPLLDWSRSPHVAAFFAFRPRNPQTERVAIYVYCGDSGHGRSTSSDTPEIVTLSRYVATHRRHFLQQCQYTVCVQRQNEWTYVPHESIFRGGTEEATQDVLWKLTLPYSERDRVLATLDGFNLNAYSLFGSEDSLMEALAEREFRSNPSFGR